MSEFVSSDLPASQVNCSVYDGAGPVMIFFFSVVNWTIHVCKLVLLLVLLTVLPVFLPRQVSLCAYLLN